jgi:hypothetical protein
VEPGDPLERVLQFAAAPYEGADFRVRRDIQTPVALRARVRGGAMIWMVFSELLPDALEEASGNLVAVIITLSIFAMVAFQVHIR